MYPKSIDDHSQWLRASHLAVLICSLLSFLWLMTAHSQAQEPKIEDRISEEMAARKDVWPIVQKLRILRKNESQLGEKHPRMANTREQIKAFEKQLSDYLSSGKGGTTSSMPNESINDKKISSDDKPDKKRVPPKNMISEPDNNRSSETSTQKSNQDFPETSMKALPDLTAFNQIEADLDKAKWDLGFSPPQIHNRLPYRLTGAFEKLTFDELSHVGFFPAMGLMWGIENIRGSPFSQIWQWHDDRQVHEKSLFMELKGSVCGLAFDQSFASNGHALVGLVMNTDESEEIGEFLCIRYQLEKLPPFQVTDRRPDVILRANCIKKSVTLRSIPSSNKIEIQGLQSPPEAFDSNVRSEHFGEKTYLISFANNDHIRPDSDTVTTEQSQTDQQNDKIREKDFLNDSAGLTAYDGTAIPEAQNARLMVLPNGKIVAVASGVVSDLAFTDKEMVGIVTGPDREPLFFSRHSLFALTRLTAVDKDIGLPTRLSMTGWFSSVAEQKLKSGFISIGEHTNTVEDGTASRAWIRIPNHQTIEIGHNGTLVYPSGTLLLQTLSTKKNTNTDTVTHRETRVLLKSPSDWELFTYRWLGDQSDAELVDISRDSSSADDTGEWRIPSRQDCIECHHRLSSNMIVGFSAQTLTTRVEGPQGMVTHLDLWKGKGLLTKQAQYNLSKRGKEETRTRLASWEPRSRTAELGIDWDWFRASAIDNNLKHWLDASPTPNGFFHVHLDGNWQPIAPAEGTVLSQSCLTYVMAEGYRLTADPRFLEATIRGTDFLLAYFHDTGHGGYWRSTNGAGKVLDRTKTSEGNAFAVFALAHAYAVTGSQQYGQAALNSWRELLTTMSDGFGGLYEKSDDSFSNRRGQYQTSVMHAFQAGVALHDATGSRQVLDDLDSIANFVTSKLWKEPGFIPEVFDEMWSTPDSNSGWLLIENGNQAKWSFLLSEGVRCGLSRRYLGFGNKLLDFNLQSGYDRDSGGLGEYDAPQKKGAWQQAEFLRAMLRYNSDHGREDLRFPIQLTSQLIKNNFADSKSGGWPIHDTKHKGDTWHCGSHEVLMYSEAIRISQNRNRSTQNRSQSKTRDAPNTTQVTQ